MAFTKTSTYIQYQGSEESAGASRSHSDTLPTSDYSGSLRSYIPVGTKFHKVIVYLRWGISRSSADGKITIGGNQVASGSGSSTRTNMTSGDVKSYFQSGTNNSGLSNSEIKFSASVDSILGANCYWCWYIQWYPIWKLTVDGGTGGGEYNMGSTVTITATVPSGYRFVKWSDGNTSATRTVTVTANATYTATFEKLKYTVTWKNADGTVLETDTNVEHGTTPTYNGSTPTKASTAQYSYAFSGWSPSVGAISGDTTYTAQFTQTLRSYTVTFKDENGATLKTETVNYGSTVTAPADPIKADTAQHKYTFDGWYDANGNKWISSTTITGDTVYTAQFTETVRSYVITASGENGTVTGGGSYEYGASVTLTATPNDGYRFVKWSDGVTTATRTVSVTGAATYTAVFEKKLLEIKSVQMIYLDKQISETNKVPCGEGFIISVELS